MKIFLDGPNIDEIKNIKNINGYTFNPSLFKKLGAKNYIQFVNELIKADLKVHWTCALRADLMGKEEDTKGNPIPREERLNLAKKFVKSGCVSAGYSLESGSDKILEAMNKKVKSKYLMMQKKLQKN